MPDRDFLEKYPLYRKLPMALPSTYLGVAHPSIHVECPICKSEQTFNMSSSYPTDAGGRLRQVQKEVVLLTYRCSGCGSFARNYLIKFDPGGACISKVGQEPPWDITPDPAVAKMLGPRVDYYKKALICESQGYGIGAFAYYRRIVEEVIEELLEEISDLLSGEERERYLEALERVKKTTITEEKISLVKDLLPTILRPGGMNPLSTLHEVLSEGLHEKPDEKCIESAEQVREVLVFLVNQINVAKTTSARFTESMRKLLDRNKRKV